MTLNDGRRVFVRRRRGVVDNNNKMSSSSPYSHSSSLFNAKKHSHDFQAACSLGISMTELNRRVLTMKRDSIRRQQQLKMTNTTTNTTAGSTKQSSNNGRLGLSSSSSSELWVDKHAPSSFPQLLSDERTNREVLRALRGWDPYVFGRQEPARPQTTTWQQQQQQTAASASAGESNKENANFTTKQNNINNNNPADKRPAENCRVIMLSGPPGVGTFFVTTLSLESMEIRVKQRPLSLTRIVLSRSRKDHIGPHCCKARGISTFGSQCFR